MALIPQVFFKLLLCSAWSAKGGDPEIAHYLLHSEGIPMNLWKSYEREGEIKKRSSTEEEAEGSGQEGRGTQTHEAKENTQAPEAKRKRRAEASLYMKTSSEPVARRDAFLEAEREAQLQTTQGEMGQKKEEEAEAEAAEERQRREEKMRAAASVKSSFVATHFRKSSKAKKGTTLKPKKVVKGGKLKNKCFR